MRGVPKVLAITGRPGIGKSTLLARIAAEAAGLGCKVGGVTTPEVRERGVRVGFKVRGLLTGGEAWLASTTPPSGAARAARVGRYFVYGESAGLLVAEELAKAVQEADLIVVDEVGPMELLLKGFKEWVVRLLSEPAKPTALTFHERLGERSPDLYNLISSKRVIRLTESNRSQYLAQARELARWLLDEAECAKGGQGAHLRA